ncbi:MAG: (2Fe-2S)-binding protein [Acidobacteria bacterium]|nr:(2Fe-2S)-binding protein [Acidobacteriota bacterium]MDW7984941.1 (2Fe-2S)-binding protein [Acidobacteriota bacterium]
MARLTLTVNGRKRVIDVSPDMPLLWVLRDVLGLTGTKFGCGIAQCGACTVHVDGRPVRSCVTPISDVAGRSVVTIEGIPADHPVKRAWVEERVPQCGYCQAGQIMGAIALLQQNPHPTETDIRTAMAGYLCRCGTYLRILQAIRRAARGPLKGAAE